MENLVRVEAYYRNAQGQTVPANPLNALMAQDAAQEWAAWRAEAVGRGWELLISPPAAGQGDYTRAMFRSPADAQWIAQNATATSAAVDSSTHQAGRAVDLDLDAMAATWSDYDYNDLVAMARRHGFTNRVYTANGTEPWHFDDDPVKQGLFPSMTAAVEAIGNTTAQVTAAVAAGLDTPQLAAIKAAAGSPLGIAVGLAAVGLGIWAFRRRRRKNAGKG